MNNAIRCASRQGRRSQFHPSSIFTLAASSCSSSSSSSSSFSPSPALFEMQSSTCTQQQQQPQHHHSLHELRNHLQYQHNARMHTFTRSHAQTQTQAQTQAQTQTQTQALGARKGDRRFIFSTIKNIFNTNTADESSVALSPAFDPAVLDFLVCPISKTKLRYDAEKQELVADGISLAYPIRDGIPILMPEEARKMKQEEEAGN